MNFIDSEYQNKYQDEGYLHLPFLDEQQLEQIDEIVHRFIYLSEDVDFVIFNKTLPEDILHRMNEAINDVIKPSLDKIIENYSILFSVLASKNSTANSKIKFHTDRCYVDESKYTPFNLWIPLCDMNMENGSFGVFPGSHNFTFTWRGINNFEYYMSDEMNQFIENNCVKYINAKRGDVVFYQSGLIHGSLENKSGKVRHALITTLMPPTGELIYCHQHHHWSNFLHKISIYKATRQFWIQPVQPSPEGILPLLRKERNKKKRVTLADLKRMSEQINR
jgi:hypothetical protein